MSPSTATPPGKDTWYCTGCGLKVELEADPGEYGAHAPKLERQGPPDFLSMHARKLLSMPEEWATFRVEVKPGAGQDYFEVTGAVCTATFTSGKRKGQKDWKKRDKATERPILIPEREHRAFVEAWEKASGLCSKCGDTGEEFEGWSLEKGCTYRPCTRCVRMDDASRAQLAAKAPQSARLTLSHVLALLPRRLLLKAALGGQVSTAHALLAGVTAHDSLTTWYLAVDEQPGPRRRLHVCRAGAGFGAHALPGPRFTEVAAGDA
jgi:hypothetical protein